MPKNANSNNIPENKDLEWYDDEDLPSSGDYDWYADEDEICSED